jgi:hypothetical protein
MSSAPRPRTGLLLSLVVLTTLAFSLQAAGAPDAVPAQTFLHEALGRTSPNAPLVRHSPDRTRTTIGDSGFKVAHQGTSVSLASREVSGGEWRRFANGVVRHTPFGSETIIVERDQTEQFLTVAQHQGIRLWQWDLRARNVVPRLTPEGAVEFLAGARRTGFLIPAVAIFDAAGKGITPAGLRWSLARHGAEWRIQLRLDDSKLRVPYVIDPAIVWQTASMAGNAGATTLVISKPAGVAVDDFLIASVTVRDNPTITPPAGWTFVRSDPVSPTTIKQAIYYKVAGSGEPVSYTWTFSTSKKASGGISRYTGVDNTNPIDASSGATGSGTGNNTAMTAPGVTTTVNDAMVVGFFGIAISTGIDPPTGMTERYQAQAAGGAADTKTTSESADATQPTLGFTGNKTATAAQGQDANWVAQLVALRPKAAAARTTSTDVSCTPNPVPVLGTTSCTATVTDDDAGTSTPQGTVTFSLVPDAGESGAFTPATGTCTLDPTATGDSNSCSVGYTPATVGDGTHEIGASYTPTDGIHAASTDPSPFQLMVRLRTTDTSVSCDPSTFEAGGSTTCTATVTDTDAGTSTPQGAVSFSASGSGNSFLPPSCTLDPTATGDSNSCSVTYSSTQAAMHTVTASYGGDPIHETSSGSTTVTVSPGPPAKVTVDPPTATNPVDTEHCVTATVTDRFDNPTPDITVVFSVTGSNTANGSRTTGPDGKTAPFCYRGVLIGITDVIRAFADFSPKNGTHDPPAEPVGVATKVWEIPASTPLCEVIVTQGGWIVAKNGDRASFGGNAQVSSAGEPKGQEEYQDHGPAQPMNVKSTEILAVTCTDDLRQASIFGLATIDGSGEFAFRIDVQDLGEPGVGQDTYRMRILAYDSGEPGTLFGGNVQIHKG